MASYHQIGVLVKCVGIYKLQTCWWGISFSECKQLQLGTWLEFMVAKVFVSFQVVQHFTEMPSNAMSKKEKQNIWRDASS